MSDAPQLARVVAAVTWRARLQRAFDALCALGAAAVALLVLQALWARVMDAKAQTGLGVWLVLVVAIGALMAAFRPVRWLPLVHAVDRTLDTPDLLSSALAFGDLPREERSPFMEACIARAEQASASVSRRALALAAPFSAPRSLAALCALTLALLALSHAQAIAPEAPLANVAVRDPLLPADTLAAFENDAEALLKTGALDPQASEVARALNALVEAIADGRLDRAQALKELRALQARLEAALADDPKALQEALEKIAKALHGSTEAKSLADALPKDLAEAEQQAKTLAERLDAKSMNERAEQALASSLKRAAAQQSASERAAAAERAKRELDRLSRDAEQSRAQGKSGAREQDQERLLRKKQRELQDLQDQQQQSERADRKLDDLKRNLDEAGNALEGGDQKRASEGMRDASNSLRDAADRARQRKQAERLARQLEQLREEVAQSQREREQNGGQQQSQAQNGGAQRLSMERFGGLARGKQSEQSEQGEGSKPGEAGAQQVMQAGQGKPGQAHGQSGQPQAGQPGKQGDPNSTLITKGDSRNASEQTMQVQAPGGGAASGSAEGSKGGREAGQNGTPDTGAATDARNAHVDTRVTGEKRGGPSRSEVILESGQRGFASESYARVHADYERHAESVLEQEHVPGGYRFYVRRYFQMIRPRGASAASTTAGTTDANDQ